ncbi:MAG: hypothetical protein JWQ96_1415 [Segetibacter sp.]|nr:hypothetical protein [Segetibacter sp.]
MRYIYSLILFVILSGAATAQGNADKILMPNIAGVKLHLQGNQLGYPIISLNSGDLLELHFDDLDARVKSYYYTFQLCNADWSAVNLSTFDYLKGFSQVRLNQYRVSSIAINKYIHYQATLPDRNCVPTKSGNYLLKVFLDGDTNKLAFTRRVLVVEPRAEIGMQILQPFNSEIFRTHQKAQFTVNAGKVNVVNAIQQIRAVVLQNYRWDNAKMNIAPTFIRSNVLEFTPENESVFPAGKEYRWADLRSFRYQSERIASAQNNSSGNNIFLKPDVERSQVRFVNFRDYNGFYFVESTDVSNPWWQGDYANVKFTFVPHNNQPYPNKKVYIVGELNSYNVSDTSAMDYNPEKGVYEKTLFLKQAYYSYTYVTKDAQRRNAIAETEQTDGNFWETENDYTVLIYYRSLAGRHDELIGVTTVNSLNNRKIGF